MGNTAPVINQASRSNAGRTLNKLNTRQIGSLRDPGRYSDGGGLYLVIGKGGARSWVFMWVTNGKRREMGIGSARDIMLIQARERAREARQLIVAGKDPIAERHNRVHVGSSNTFGQVAEELITSLERGFKNKKHRQQWRMTLKVYAASLSSKPVDQIYTEDVLKLLNPIWHEKPETARRVRGRIESVLDAATARGLRSGENPARWRGNLQAVLGRAKKLTRGHHAAMPYDHVPSFLARLQDAGGVAGLALEFLILTAARTGEVIGAQWSEIDLNKAVWTIPASRMKSDRGHRVPLSDRALTILKEMGTIKQSEFVFPGRKRGTGLSNMSMAAVLKRLQLKLVTVHGFRSSFRDWCGEETSYPRDVAEAALAHAIDNETERAYRRGDAFAKRRELMDVWEQYCTRAALGASSDENN